MKPIDSEAIYRDGLHYDAQHSYFTMGVDFYIEQAKKCGSPVLEIACGTGRVTIPIFEAGIEITGLDVSDGMLAQAEKKSKEKELNIEWIKADCRNFELNKKFNLIIFPFNSIAHLHDLESIKSCFTCVKNHLAKDGKFILDFFNPSLEILMRDPSKRYPSDWEYDDPYGNGTVSITENNIYDNATQVNRIKWYYKIGEEVDVHTVELNMRIFYPQELDALLYYNGFKIEAKYGAFDKSIFNSESSKQIIISVDEGMS